MNVKVLYKLLHVFSFLIIHVYIAICLQMSSALLVR